MEIINGQEVERSWVYGGTVGSRVQTYTDDHTVLTSQSGATLVMNSSSNKAFTLPTVTAADIGLVYTFVNVNTGRLTIQVAGTGVMIVDSTPTTGTIYVDTDEYATMTLRLVSATKWLVIGAHGTWTTT